MSSGKVGRMTDKVTYLRSLGKTALQLYINEHYEKTGEKLKEWQAWEQIIQTHLPELYKRARKLEEKSSSSNGGK